MHAAFFRHLLFFVLGVTAFQMLAGIAFADDGTGTLQANFLTELVGNRSRMIQASLVFVVLGCAMLWWRK